MRTLRLVGWSVGMLVVVLGLAFVALQTGPGQRFLAKSISDVASAPQRQVVLTGLRGFIPTDLKVERIELKDDKGVWFSANDASLQWSLASLLSGRLRIGTLSAARVEVLRPPLPSPSSPSTSGDSSLPIEIDLKGFSIGDLHLAAPIGGVDSHWTASGAVLLASKASRLKLSLVRTDGPIAEVKADMKFDLAPFSIAGEVVAEERSKGGVIAALLDKPDLDSVTVTVKANGGPAAGSVDLSAGAQDVASSLGKFEWRRAGARTDFSWSIEVKAPGLPDSAAARLVRQSLTFDGEAILDGQKLLTVRRADLHAGPMQVALSGSYDIPGERLDSDIVLRTDETGAVADLLAPAASAARAPIVGPAEIRLKLGMRAGGNGRVVVDIADLAPFAAFAGSPLAGRAHFEIDGVTQGTDTRVRWTGRLQDLALGGVLPEMLRGAVHLEGNAILDRDSWNLRGASFASEALKAEVEGRGQGPAGELRVTLEAPRTQALHEGVDGHLTARAHVFFGDDGIRGTAVLGGAIQDKPLSLRGQFSHNGSDFSVPKLEGSWASGSIHAEDLFLTPTGATGHARLEIARTADFSSVAEFSRLVATVDGDGKGFDVALQSSGPKANADLAGRIVPDGGEIQVVLSRFSGRYDGLPLKLVAPANVRVIGSRAVVDGAAFDLGGGKVNAKGVVGLASTNLSVDVAGLPLKLLNAFVPGGDLDGTAQAKLQITGPIAMPRVDATYSVVGLRVKRPETALVPAAAVQGKLQLAGRQVTADATVSAGGTGAVQAKVKADLRSAQVSASVGLSGTLNIAPFAPLFGTAVNNVAGTLRPDVTLDIRGSRITGRGTIAASGLTVVLPASGLRLSNGTGSFALEGDALQVQRLSFQTADKGEVTATGKIGLDAAQGTPIDLALTLRRALLVKRLDLVATVSCNLKVTGALAKAIDVSGLVTIDRAEIAIGAPETANYPTVEVREVNGRHTKVQALQREPAARPASPKSPFAVRLALTVEAPRAVFVRGRGLDAEVGGSFKVSGEAARPTVLGGLSLRRGELSLAGRRFAFSRGNVSLMNVDTIDPRLDFAASTSVSGSTIEIAIKGTPRAPVFGVTSQPQLPPDEAMAMLLFGKPASGLSVSQLVTAAQALAELTGNAPSGGGFFGRLRRGLGLDQFSVDTPAGTGAGSSALGGASVQGGKYVAPGVYVGAKQGTSADTSRGVVEIEVLPHTKLEGNIGADSNGRIGAKLEWDY